MTGNICSTWLNIKSYQNNDQPYLFDPFITVGKTEMSNTWSGEC